MTISEVGDKFPLAAVLWDRDVSGEGWEPVFRMRGSVFAPWDSILFADSATCPHSSGRAADPGGCRCRVWTGDAWITRSQAINRLDRLPK
jgi:hypothetical protein